jgi:outer membrane lipoprotein-sorting protein
LDFTKNPFALAQWQIIDANGFVTLVKLKNVKRGHDLKNSLFVFKLPESSKYRGFNN